MKNLMLAFLTATLAGCIAHVDQGKLEPVQSGERIHLAAPVKAIENRGLVKLEWLLLPGTYVEKYSNPLGRVFLSEARTVQSTNTLGEKTPLGPVSGRHGSLTLITDFPLSDIKRR